MLPALGRDTQICRYFAKKIPINKLGRGRGLQECRHLLRSMTTTVERQRMVATNRYVNCSSTKDGSFRWFLNGGSAAVIGGGLMLLSSASIIATDCDQQQEAVTVEATMKTANQQTEKEEENKKGKETIEDPYENLPEEDEPTTCSMCLTYRQGPCRSTWRKCEKCFKDHMDDPEGNGAKICGKYSVAFQRCLFSNIRLYSLIDLEPKQEMAEKVEIAISHKNEKSDYKEGIVQIDWTAMQQFVAIEKQRGNETFERQFFPDSLVNTNDNQTVNGSRQRKPPLWKRVLPKEYRGGADDLAVISLDSKIPITPELEQDSTSNHLFLSVAYAIDQDGMVLGLATNPMYNNLQKMAENYDSKDQARKSGSVGDDNDQRNSGDDSARIKQKDGGADDSEYMDLDFVVIPGETKNVQFCGLYAENPVLKSILVDNNENDTKGRDRKQIMLKKTKQFSLDPSMFP